MYNKLKMCDVQISVPVPVKDEIRTEHGGAVPQGCDCQSLWGNPQVKGDIPTACFSFPSKNTLPPNFSLASK